MKQLSIFKADQFQYNNSILGFYQKPRANISFSILAPIPLNCLRSAYTVSSEHPVKIRCLAIDDSGLVIVAPLLKFDGDCEKLLSQLIECIEETKLNYLDSSGPITPILMESIKDARFWNIHNKTSSSLVEQSVEMARNNNCIEHISIDDSYKYLSDQLIENINESINYLNPFIKELIIHRPDLDLTIISNFMYRARVYGGNALEYAKQALRVEPIPILRLIACEPSNTLIVTVFSGNSLPKALSKYLSVDSAIIRHLSKNAMVIPDISTTKFTIALEVIKHLEIKFWPNDKRTWKYLIERIECWYLKVRNKPISDRAPLFATLLASYKLIFNQHGTLVWQNHLVNNIPGTSLEKSAYALYEGAENFIVNYKVRANSKSNLYQTSSLSYRLVMSFLESKPDSFCKEWFKFHPDLEPISTDGYQFKIVKELGACHYLGGVLKNCLGNPENMLKNLFPNNMLFCISDKAKPLALFTVAVNEVYSEPNSDTHHQLKGPNNSDVSDSIKKACISFMIMLEGYKEVMSDFYLLSKELHLFQEIRKRVH